jgi:UDP-N-acetylglucosamine--N-acetylmuramyl-(pentapeptide) pyrophosphoryl-undecaprenol N-acetylglucosamine transferase
VTRVAIAGGGTGGHLFPGLAVADELRARGAKVVWLGARRGLEASRIPPTGIPLRLLAVTGAVARSPLAQAGAALRVVPATLQAARFLLGYQVDALLSVGGYAALPGALAAGLLGVPVVIQEQNAGPGVVNRLLAPWSVVVACGFETAVKAFPSLPARFTGNPIRPEFFRVPQASTTPVSVLVLGGSQGSRFLNERLPGAFAALRARAVVPRVVHQCGARWEAEVRARYADLGLDAEVEPFLERPAEALATATLVVGRAGALTVCELAAARRAALLVPFAAAAHGHQLLNARALASTGAAEVIEERDASEDALAATLARLLSRPEELAARGRAGAAIARADAASIVAGELLRVAGCAVSTNAQASGDQLAHASHGGGT